MPEAPKPIAIDSPVTITVNGTEVTAQKGELLIDACERAGTYIPRFCYHPRMNPVGMCRMCLVEVDTGRGPALQPSCMLECGDGMSVDTQSEKVQKAQDGVLEFLLINHPLDCPVCDKGGECPLQDTTMSFGPGESRWVEEKRHYRKPIPISETVNLDRERCILCDRCTRFADEVVGDPLIHFTTSWNVTRTNASTISPSPTSVVTTWTFKFIGLRRIFSSSRNIITPPSTTGSGMKLITARLTEMYARKDKRSPMLASACCMATRTMPSGPETSCTPTRPRGDSMLRRTA